MKVKNILNISEEGTYSFCSMCSSEGNCCSRVKPKGQIDAPVLFRNEVNNIEKSTEIDRNDFSLANSKSHKNVRLMRTNEDGCYFYRNGKCDIYHLRPIDCRLFPLDFYQESDGRIILIAYTNLCPVDYNPYDYIKQAKELIYSLGSDLFTYAKLEAPGMDLQPYIILCELEFP